MPKKKATHPYTEGQYVVCRYALSAGKSNGDLIAGQISSVRNNRDKDVLIINLLSPILKKSIKQVHVLSRRNVVVPKKEAMKVVAMFKTSGRQAARELAVQIAEKFSPTPTRRSKPGLRVAEKPNEIVPINKLTVALDAYNDMSADEKRAFARAVWADVLSTLGVA